MKANNFTKLDFKEAVISYFNLLSVGREYNTVLGKKVKSCHGQLGRFRLWDSEAKAILLETFGDSKKFNRKIQELELRSSTEPNIKRIRQDMFKSFKVNNWYSSEEVFNKVSEIAKENDRECANKNKASETLNFLFETEPTLKRMNESVVRGFTIKAVK